MKGLRTVIYKVPDMEQAKVWYAQAFEVKPYFDEPFYIGYNIGGYELGIQPRVEGDKGTGDNVLVYWGVDDVKEKYDHLIQMGAKSHEEPTNVGGPIEVATVYDPWGNLLGLIYNPTFKLPEEED